MLQGSDMELCASVRAKLTEHLSQIVEGFVEFIKLEPEQDIETNTEIKKKYSILCLFQSLARA